MLKHLIFIFLVGASAHSCVMNAHATETVVKAPMTEVLKENNWTVKDLKTMCDDIANAPDDVRESEAIQRIEEVFEDSDAVCGGLK